MNGYPNSVKDNLTSLINEISESPSLFVKNPGKDFTRNRKLPLATVFKLLISMGGNSIYKELLESQGYNESTATSSAFIQQRDKILPCAFEFLLHEFNKTHTDLKKYRDYRLIAADGSILHIPSNPDDTDSYCQTKHDSSGYNLLHMTAMYDLLNKIYTDTCVQPINGHNEYKAFRDMIKRAHFDGRAIIIADRNYESYNNFANIERKGWNYVIRTKDLSSKSGILEGLHLKLQGEFDVVIKRILTRKQTKKVKAEPELYKLISSKSPFDFLDLHTNIYYPISFRIVRFKIENDSFQTVITNLCQSDFPAHEIK
ncbi:MAG: transposase, partial [Oscillospiraceae bacterium]|nr:transposase [Oscillospiraceae bacterium]